MIVDGYEPEAALAMLDAASKAGCRSVLDVESGDRETSIELLKLSTDCILPLAAARALPAKRRPKSRCIIWRSRRTAQLS